MGILIMRDPREYNINKYINLMIYNNVIINRRTIFWEIYNIPKM